MFNRLTPLTVTTAAGLLLLALLALFGRAPGGGAVPPAAAAAVPTTLTPTLTVAAPAGPLPANEPVDVPILVANAADLAGFEFRLTVNPALATVTGVTLGPFLGATGSCDPAGSRCATPLQLSGANGRFDVGGYSVGAAPAAGGSGTLITLHLQPTGLAGQLPLQLEQALLVDAAVANVTLPTVSAASLTFVATQTTYLPAILHTAAPAPAVAAAAPVTAPDAAAPPAAGAPAAAPNPPPPADARLAAPFFLAQGHLTSHAGSGVAGMIPDVNADGWTDVIDLQLTAACWNQPPTAPGCSLAFDLNQDGLIDRADLDRIAARWHLLPTTLAKTSPAAGEQSVAVTRESILTFDRPIDAGSVTTGTLAASFAGQPLPGWLHVGQDGRRLTYFYTSTLPASARVRLTLHGSPLVDADGYAVDVDGDGVAGGTRTLDFDTLSLTVVPGTAVCGHVFASELADDGSGGTVDLPLEGTTITVDGRETTLFTTTDASGAFCLNPAPAGRFFVHVDGRTATVGVPPGAYYPFVGKAWTGVPGRSIDVGNVYLPLVTPNTLQPVSPVTDTVIHFSPDVLAQYPEFADVRITVPADSLYADDGSRGGSVGIAPVPPDRLPGTLPPMLNFPVVITVQTDGATNFDTPAPVCFPNLPDPVTGAPLPASSDSALYSFNHDTGKWTVIGPMSVTADGTLVCTDPGVGVEAPGWHGSQPGVPADGGPINGPTPPERPCPSPPGQTCTYEPDPDYDPVAYVNGCGPDGYGSLVPDDPIRTSVPFMPYPLNGPTYDGPVDTSFDRACNSHDLCYSQCGGSRRLCDQNMLNDTLSACEGLNGHPSDPTGEFYQRCVDLAFFYNFKVSEGGDDAYDDAQDAACECQCTSTGAAPGAPSAGPLFRAPSAAAGDPQTGLHYFALFDEATGQAVLRGTAGSSGIAHDTLMLAPNTTYRHAILQAATLRDGDALFTTGRSGIRVDIPAVAINPSPSLDFDGDDLPDIGEAIMGTAVLNPDTDGDGLLDGFEVQQGLNPLDGLPAATGIIASVNTAGTAVDLCARDDLAAVATADAGVTLLDVSGTNPIIIAQVDTPGNARRVTCATDLIVAADREGGVAVVDVADPPAAFIRHQIPLGSPVQAVATLDGIAYAGTASGLVAAVDLASGAVVEQLSVGGSVQDLQFGRDLLYVVTPGKLHTLRLSGGLALLDSDDSPGRIGAGGWPLRLFVGDAVAYAVHTRGYNTFDLTIPTDPTLIAAGATAQFGWRHLATNGAGLGIAAVGPNSTGSGPHHVSLYDVGDPAQTDRFLTEFDTPGSAQAVSIFNGLAYVADGSAGVQVLNYLAYDAQGVPPTITLTTTAAAGVEEGHILFAGAVISDDVQVRAVDFFVDGQLAAGDGSFPFAYRTQAPLQAQQPQLRLQARAADTGGNVAWSDPLTITILPDMTPPQVVSQSPPDGVTAYDTAAAVTAVSAYFSEPVDPATLTAASFRLAEAGGDGVVGTPDDVPVAATLSYQGALDLALLTLGSPLPPGLYGVVISSTVADVAGNPLAAPVSWQFELQDGVFGDWEVAQHVPFADPMAAHLNPVDGLVYVGRRIGNDGLYRIEADGTETKLATADRPAAVVADPASGALFLSEDFGGRIYRTVITGTGRTQWVSGLHSGDDDPIGMVVATAAYSGSLLLPGEALVVDRGNGGPDEVWRFSTLAAGGETVVHADNGTLVDAVDITLTAAEVYLVDTGLGGNGVLYRLDAGGGLTPLTTTLSLPNPSGITYDPLGGRLLVQESGLDQVLWIDLPTGVVTDALPGFPFQFSTGGAPWAGVDIAPDGQTLVVTDRGADAIFIFRRR